MSVYELVKGRLSIIQPPTADDIESAYTNGRRFFVPIENIRNFDGVIIPFRWGKNDSPFVAFDNVIKRSMLALGHASQIPVLYGIIHNTTFTPYMLSAVAFLNETDASMFITTIPHVCGYHPEVEFLNEHYNKKVINHFNSSIK